MFLADVYDGVYHSFFLILNILKWSFDLIKLKFTIYPHHDLFIFKYPYLLLSNLKPTVFLP
jgi:hypothetical protein